MRRRRVADDQESGDPAASPSAFGGDPWRETSLPVETVERRLAVRDDGLDFDDQHDPRLPMEREHVDRASLAVDRERDLDSDVPP
jgi:hypothetical protein